MTLRSLLDLPRLDPSPHAPFPDADGALDSPNGLLAWGGDLQPERLIRAYSQGIFPWYSEGQPILWWSPAPRCVLFPERVYLSTRSRRRYNSGRYRLTVDQAFKDVVSACAAPREYDPGTWITDDMAQAYCRLHDSGHAHSLEVWRQDKLVGGIYGILLGRVFFGESMFARETDGSKLALVALCKHLHSLGVALLDCQVANDHLFTMGAVEIPRDVFQRELGKCVGANALNRSFREFEPESRW